MATIRKRVLPSSAVVWQADYRDRDGKRRAKQFPTRKAADDYLVTVRSDLRQGRHVAPGASITIDQAGELWIERAERDQLVRSTRRQYRQHLTHHISPTLGKVKLAELTAPRVYAFIDDTLQTTSRATARKVLTSLGSIVEEAVRRGLAAHNPVRSVKMTKATAEEAAGAEIEMPTKDELRAILAAASGRWRPLIVTAMFTGMRGSELRGLRWTDVDLKSGVIHVRRRVDHWKDFGPPKSRAGKRDIPLAPMVVTELRRWRLACPKGDLDLAFPSPAGGVLSHACILKDGFGPLQLAAGVVHHVPHADGETAPKAKYGLHALRHAAAALFIEQGFGPKRIQTILGHASIKMTYDVYGYLFASEEDDRAGMAAIEARLLGPRT
jgi:integrase